MVIYSLAYKCAIFLEESVSFVWLNADFQIVKYNTFGCQNQKIQVDFKCGTRDSLAALPRNNINTITKPGK